MSREALTFAADLTLLAHAAFIVFVVAGQGLILAGWMLGWRWPRNVPFRLAHIGAIALVMLESWFGVTCPLTWIEFTLRAAAGSPLAADSFVGYWLQRLIFYDAPSWAFTLAYTVFAAATGGNLRLLSSDKAPRAVRLRLISAQRRQPGRVPDGRNDARHPDIARGPRRRRAAGLQPVPDGSGADAQRLRNTTTPSAPSNPWRIHPADPSQSQRC